MEAMHVSKKTTSRRLFFEPKLFFNIMIAGQIAELSEILTR